MQSKTCVDKLEDTYLGEDMSLITSDFVAKYEEKQPPWGFGGLGEIVYLRTYSRKIDGSYRNKSSIIWKIQ